MRKRKATPPEDFATLTQESFLLAVSALGARDADLARVVATHGSPPFWTHAPGFPGLVIAILAQQVSLESAQAAFAKLEMAIGSIHPEGRGIPLNPIIFISENRIPYLPYSPNFRREKPSFELSSPIQEQEFKRKT